MRELRKIRLDAGLTQAGLAKKAGVHRVTVSNAEAGHRLQADTLYRLAQVLGVRPTEIAESERVGPKVPGELTSPLALEHLEDFRARVATVEAAELEAISQELSELSENLAEPTTREDYKIMHGLAMKSAAVMLRYKRLREAEERERGAGDPRQETREVTLA